MERESPYTDSGYKLRKSNSSTQNKEPNTTNYNTIIGNIVYKSDDALTHLYVKIPLSAVNATGRTYLAVFDGGNNPAWQGTGKNVTVKYGDELTKQILEVRREEYNSTNDKYSSINFVSGADTSVIDYILLDVTRTDSYNGVYNYYAIPKEEYNFKNIYAKDGALTESSNTAGKGYTFANIADTKITKVNGTNVTARDHEGAHDSGQTYQSNH